MARWEPNSRGRLEEAALALYRERGFDQTTVAEIAERAGLTERTFFRYFADKREVLFGGSEALKELLVRALMEAPGEARPIDAVGGALEAAAAALQERRNRDYARTRQAIITSHAELYERELIKLASLAVALAEGLRERGVTDPAATLTAEAGIAVFKVAFQRWVEDARGRDFVQHIRESMRHLQGAVAVQTARSPARARRAR